MSQATLSATIKMSKTCFTKDEPVQMTFELTNTDTSTAYHVLKWHTPLEGFHNRFLKVCCRGKEVQYHGIMVKRGNPLVEDYTLIAAGGSECATLDLHTGYDMSSSGTYTVELDTRLMDVVADKAGVEFTPHKLSDAMTSQKLTAGPVSFEINQ